MTPGAPLVGLTHGPVWARAEPSTPGVDLGHGGLKVVVRAGTVLLDAQGGAGLMIVMRGEVEITMSGQEPRIARAGEALSFDGSGAISEPDPVDAAELARDPFVSLNLVLDALGGGLSPFPTRRRLSRWTRAPMMHPRPTSPLSPGPGRAGSSPVAGSDGGSTPSRLMSSAAAGANPGPP